MERKKYQLKYYNIMTRATILCFLTSNFGAIQLINIFADVQLDAGTLIFHIIFIFNNIITEVYGFSEYCKNILIAICSNIFLTIFLYLVVMLPSAPDFYAQKEFETIFSISPLIVTASVISYFIGGVLNSIIIAFLKIRYKGKFFALRAVFSTSIGSFVETIIFCFIAFSNIISRDGLFKMIILLYAVKVLYQIVAMPITIKVVAFLKLTEGKDVFERPSFKGLSPILKN